MKSKQPRKQRKALFNAPVHRRSRNVSSHLSPSLKKEYGRRSIRVIKGDTVLILRGEKEFVGTEGKVTAVDTKTGRVTIEGVTISKADGSEVARPIHASNLMITKLNLSDPMRKERLMRSEEEA